ncbi:MAG: hypothetical protein JJE55_05210 [Flavobacteriaceae bacterium]|nr:hypothetical protein [Flavobacteriaceae bacterium]
MEQKKDIGALFEKGLNDGKKIPNKSLWEKINTTLDEEKRRKKRILYYWFVGAGLSVLLGLFLLLGNGIFSPSNYNLPENNTSSPNQSISTLEKISNETSLENSTKDSLSHQTYTEEKLSKIKYVQEDSVLMKNENTSKLIPETKTEKILSKNKSKNENYSVSKNYYYYNSRDGKRLVTSDKKVIDSLLLDKSLDSVNIKKIDSLEH